MKYQYERRGRENFVTGKDFAGTIFYNHEMRIIIHAKSPMKQTRKGESNLWKGH